MLLSLLNSRRPEVDLDLIADYWALFRGGKAFHCRLDRFLPQRPSESPAMYAFRKKSAHYLNYAGPIVSYVAALVFSERMEIASEPAQTDPFYAEFQTNCDTLGTDLADLLRERFTRALVTQRAWVLVDFPAATGQLPADRKAWEERGLGRAYLCPLNDEQIIDWEVDDRGELEWALVHQCDTRRRNLGVARGERVRETWTFWGRESWQRFEVEYDKAHPPKPEDNIPLVAEGLVATQGRVPLVCIDLPDALWAMNILADPQLEQTRKRNSLSWGMDRTCFAQQVYKLDEPLGDGGEEDQVGGRGPTQGWGYAQVIGTKEDIVWDAPPSEAFTVIADYAAALKDEIYRVVHQMALGVQNNAAAVGRSGASKKEDNSATAIVARSIGKLVTETTKRILDLVALGRRETTRWTVNGMDSYVTIDEQAAVETAVMFDTTNVPSPTARREAAKQVAFAYLRNLTPEQRAKISKEIDAGITDEDVDARELPDAGKTTEDDPAEKDGAETEDPAEDDTEAD